LVVKKEFFGCELHGFSRISQFVQTEPKANVNAGYREPLDSACLAIYLRLVILKQNNFKCIIMKKLLLIAAIAFATTSFANEPAEVNEKVLNAFEQTFHRVSDLVWHEYDAYYLASFSQGEIKVRARYDKDGNILSTLRYYTEKHLPPNLVNKLNQKYADQQVYGVTEVSTENTLKYVITLKDKKNWYIVESDPFGNMVRTDKFKKA